jgi:hypothetical protein
MVQKILNAIQRIFMIRRYKSKEEELRAGLRMFTTWHEPEVITPEEYEELQKMLEEFERQ